MIYPRGLRLARSPYLDPTCVGVRAIPRTDAISLPGLNLSQRDGQPGKQEMETSYVWPNFTYRNLFTMSSEAGMLRPTGSGANPFQRRVIYNLHPSSLFPESEAK